MSGEELSGRMVARYQKMVELAQTLSAEVKQATLEGVPTALLGEVLAYLDEVDVLARVFNLNRRMRLRVCAPGAVRALRLEQVFQTDRAVGVLSPDAWKLLRSLHVAAAAVPPYLERCLGWLGASLRDLHFEAYAQAPEYGFRTLPALVWPTLRACNYVVKKDVETQRRSRPRPRAPDLDIPLIVYTGCPMFPVDPDGKRRAAATVGPALPALERLGLCCAALGLGATVTVDRHVARFLSGAVGGSLRALSLSVPNVTNEMLEALGPIAPALEALHLHESVRRSQTRHLPSLPRVHTLALTCTPAPVPVVVDRRLQVWGECPYTLPATPHRALRHLHLSGVVRLEVSTEGKGGGEGWAVDALHSLVYDSLQVHARLLALLEPACHTLRLLSCVTATAAPDAGFAGFRVPESAWCRVGPLIRRAAATLQDLSVQFDVDMSEQSRPRTDLVVELDDCPALHTLRLSVMYLPQMDDAAWTRARDTLRRVVAVESTLGSSHYPSSRAFHDPLPMPRATLFRQYYRSVVRPEALAGLATAYSSAADELIPLFVSSVPTIGAATLPLA